jgi:uncharacterized phage-associated protein
MVARTLQTEPGIEFDREKFLDAIHFIIDACRRSPELLGKTKLHKCLYYSDMLHFVVSRRPLTGAEYVKAQFGPTARYLEWGLKTLRERGRISIRQEEYFGLGKYAFYSEQEPQSNRLSDEEKALMGEVIAFVCERTAREISEISHAAPWQNAKMGERIPYSSAHLLLPPTRQPSQRDVDYATQHARRLKLA